MNSRAASAASVPAGHSPASTPAAMRLSSCAWVRVSAARTAIAIAGGAVMSRMPAGLWVLAGVVEVRELGAPGNLAVARSRVADWVPSSSWA